MRARALIQRLMVGGIVWATMAWPAPAVAQVEPAAPADLGAALDAASNLPRLHSFLVSWRGAVVAERYYGGARATRQANIKSASKSVISALVGIAIERGLIPGVAEPVSSYFAEQVKADTRKQRITVEDLLTMRSGLETTSSRNYGAWVLSRNWVQHALARPLVTEPGTSMEYSTGNTHLLSAILTRAAGESTRQFAQKALAGPLGFTLAEWPRDPQGVYFGGNDMLMTPRQMLAFGELYLNRGSAGGRQIVPAAWVDESFIPRARSPRSEQLYGYGWWIRDLAGHRVSYAWGFGGQYIFVVPALDLVIVTTSSTAIGEDRRSHRVTVMDLVERFVLPAVTQASYLTLGSAPQQLLR
jgi:CubicO group peptidase (beta-lactamase class C family)